MESKKFKFIKGNEYKMCRKVRVPYRAYRGTNIPSEWSIEEIKGNFEYIGNHGCKLHFFEQQRGLDLFLSKSEAIECLIL